MKPLCCHKMVSTYERIYTQINSLAGRLLLHPLLSATNLQQSCRASVLNDQDAFAQCDPFDTIVGCNYGRIKYDLR